MLKNLEETLEIWGEVIADEYKITLKTEGINASGKLSNSVKSLFSANGNLYEVSLQLEDYYKMIEDGRKPTKNGGNGELRRNILNWIRVKPILPQPYNGKLPTEQQLAYLISRKIHRLGYEGKQPLKKSVDKYRSNIISDIEKALQEDLTADVLKILSTMV